MRSAFEVETEAPQLVFELAVAEVLGLNRVEHRDVQLAVSERASHAEHRALPVDELAVAG